MSGDWYNSTTELKAEMTTHISLLRWCQWLYGESHTEECMTSLAPAQPRETVVHNGEDRA